MSKTGPGLGEIKHTTVTGDSVTSADLNKSEFLRMYENIKLMRYHKVKGITIFKTKVLGFSKGLFWDTFLHSSPQTKSTEISLERYLIHLIQITFWKTKKLELSTRVIKFPPWLVLLKRKIVSIFWIYTILILFTLLW